MFRIATLSSLLLISACTTEVQNTSGRAYLADSQIADRDIAASASYEPNLTLPARIGLIRLVYGRVTTTPADELTMYKESLSGDLGSITQLGSLEAQTAGFDSGDKPFRQLAASRHLDHVLIISLNPQSGTAEALFLDVRTGYPYASIELTGDGRSHSNAFGGRIRNQNRLNRATLKLAQTLQPALEEMAEQLIAEARR